MERWVSPSVTLNSEPNVTPFLDVLLVVMIVFLVAAAQVYHTMDAVLPQPCSGVCDGGTPIVLEVLPGPAYRINKTPVATRQLASEISRIFAPRPEKIIQIAGHPGVRYEEVVEAMDVAKAACVKVLSVPPKSSYLLR